MSVLLFCSTCTASENNSTFDFTDALGQGVELIGKFGVTISFDNETIGQIAENKFNETVKETKTAAIKKLEEVQSDLEDTKDTALISMNETVNETVNATVVAKNEAIESAVNKTVEMKERAVGSALNTLDKAALIQGNLVNETLNETMNSTSEFKEQAVAIIKNATEEVGNKSDLEILSITL